MSLPKGIVVDKTLSLWKLSNKNEFTNPNKSDVHVYVTIPKIFELSNLDDLKNLFAVPIVTSRLDDTTITFCFLEKKHI